MIEIINGNPTTLETVNLALLCQKIDKESKVSRHSTFHILFKNYLLLIYFRNIHRSFINWWNAARDLNQTWLWWAHHYLMFWRWWPVCQIPAPVEDPLVSHRIVYIKKRFIIFESPGLTLDIGKFLSEEVIKQSEVLESLEIFDEWVKILYKERVNNK